MAVDGEVGGESLSVHGATHQPVAYQVHGVARRQRGRVVADDRHAVADGVVSPRVAPEAVPTPALVDVSIRADHEAEGAEKPPRVSVVGSNNQKLIALTLKH